jgi:hypothetical protein
MGGVPYSVIAKNDGDGPVPSGNRAGNPQGDHDVKAM